VAARAAIAGGIWVAGLALLARAWEPVVVGKHHSDQPRTREAPISTALPPAWRRRGSTTTGSQLLALAGDHLLRRLAAHRLADSPPVTRAAAVAARAAIAGGGDRGGPGVVARIGHHQQGDDPGRQHRGGEGGGQRRRTLTTVLTLVWLWLGRRDLVALVRGEAGEEGSVLRARNATRVAATAAAQVS
jgi:hypothetical protein